MLPAERPGVAIVTVCGEVDTAKPVVLRWVREAGHQPRAAQRTKNAPAT